MACTSTTVSITCATCGTNFDATLDSDGTVDACYGSVMTAHNDHLVDDATGVGQHLDDDVPDDHTAVVYAECEDCCPTCSDPDSTHEQ